MSKRDPAVDLATREGVERFVEYFVCATATGWFEQHGCHPLAVYILATRSFEETQIPPGTIGVICLLAKSIHTDADKDFFLAHARYVVEASCAIGVVTVMEAWSVHAASLAEYYKYGSVEHHPRREETMIVLLEHVRTQGRWLAPIRREGEKVTLEAFVRHGDEVFGEGRFADLLQKQRFA